MIRNEGDDARGCMIMHDDVHILMMIWIQGIFQQSYLCLVACSICVSVVMIFQVINDDTAAASNHDDMNAGNIPAELSQLSSLQMLGLSSNNLSGN